MDARLQTLIDTARSFGGDQYHSILLWGDDAWNALRVSGATYRATLYRYPDHAYVIESLTLKDGDIEIKSQRSRGPATAEDIARANDEDVHHHVDDYASTDIGGAR